MRKKNAQIIFILITVLLNSCTESRVETEFTLNSFDKSFYLKDGQSYENDSLFLGNPRWIRFHPDSFLIIQEMGSAKMLTVIDLKCNMIQKLISKGKGPGEMISVWGIEILNKDLYAFCGQLRKVIKLSPGKDRRFNIIDEFMLDEKQSKGTYPLTENLLVCLSNIGDVNRFTYLTGEGKIIRKFGDYPTLLNSDQVKPDNDIFGSYISANSNGSKFVVVCAYTDIIEIYDTEKGLERRIHGPLGINLEAHYVKVGPGRMTRREPGYLTYCMADANIDEFWTGFISYKGEKNKGPRLTEAYPKQIFCFNWKGKPLRIINLEFPVFAFDVDWGNKILYCIKCDEESPGLISFSIKDILK